MREIVVSIKIHDIRRVEMISNHCFCEMVKAVRAQDAYIGKIEDALGVTLEDAWKPMTDILDALEYEMDCGIWEDEVFDRIFNTEEKPSDIYFYLLNQNRPKEREEDVEEE